MRRLNFAYPLLLSAFLAGCGEGASVSPPDAAVPDMQALSMPDAGNPRDFMTEDSGNPEGLDMPPPPDLPPTPDAEPVDAAQVTDGRVLVDAVPVTDVVPPPDSPLPPPMDA